MITRSSRLSLRLALFPLLVLSLSSCLGPHKVNKWVNHHYSETPPPVFDKPISGISLTSPLKTGDQVLSVTEKNSKVLPLLFFWSWTIDNHCRINASVPLGLFADGVAAEASDIGLNRKLGGKTVEASIREIPHRLNVRDEGWAVWVILSYLGMEAISVGPEDDRLLVQWHFVENGVAGDDHQFIYLQQTRPLYVKYMQSVRKTSGRSLSAYDHRAADSGRMFADEIARYLK